VCFFCREVLDLVDSEGFILRVTSSSTRLFWEFQLNESSRYKKTEDTSVAVKISDIGYGSREAGRKTSFRWVKSRCALRVICTVITVEDLLQFVLVKNK
jgi:hypothetical protein